MTSDLKAISTLLIVVFCWLNVVSTALADAIPATVSGDSQKSTQEWNEFYLSGIDLFSPGNIYQISFDYKSIALSPNANFYVLVRDKDAPSRTFAWQDWRADAGKTGTMQTLFTPKSAGSYQLIFGIHFLGAVTISNVKITSKKIIVPPPVSLPRPARTWTSPGHATYYVDSSSGNDANDGLSQAHPWQTLSKVNSGTFSPGDRILLRSGSAWTGYLALAGSGAEGSPIVVDRYASGSKPRIDAQGKWQATLFESNESYVTVRNIEIVNKGVVPQPHLAGVEVDEWKFGTAHQIILDGLNIHDVTGSDVKDDGGGAGINCNSVSSGVPTRFDGLTIENCQLTHTDRNGITMDGNWSRTNWFPSLNVAIRNNVLKDIGGDGIVPIACDGAVVEHNVIAGCRTRAQDYCAGIWPWSCDNTVIQYNDVSGMRGTMDGEGYDSDYNCRNTLFQYNFSHNNDGGFMLICDNGGSQPPDNIGNIGTVIRYNVSIDDGLHTFHITGPVSDTNVYNNTIYIGQGAADLLVASDSWGGLQDNTVFTDNVFLTAQKAGFEARGDQQFTLSHNLFSGDFENLPADSKVLLANPRLLRPGSTRPSDYRPSDSSPCLSAGEIIPDNGGRDFLGSPAPQNAPPTIGAFQR